MGDENVFLKLAKSIRDLTALGVTKSIDILGLDFTVKDGEDKEIIFASRNGSKLLGVFDNENRLVFELDPRYWGRIFKYFILISWKKSTY